MLLLSLAWLVAGDSTGTAILPAAWQPTPAQVLAGWSNGSGPILVLTSAGNGFTRYLAEILGSEGFGGEFAQADVTELGSTVDLRGYSRIVLGDATVSPAGVAALADWTRAGGTLIAMHPGDNLAPLLGLGPSVGVIGDGYLRVTDPDLAAATYAGVLQYHGAARARRLLPGTRALAMLYRGAGGPTIFPAVSVREVGGRGGTAIAFAYDLARSVVYTRQGNAAWASQNRDSELGPGGTPLCEPTDCLKRTDDLFAGVTVPGTSTWTSNWVDLGNNQVPQADLQQRLLVDLLESSAPLPRLWYLPTYAPAPGGLLQAAVVLTGDDHNRKSETVRRFTAERDDPRQPPGCGQHGTPVDPATLASWRCVRSTSYAYSGATTDGTALRFDALGFEISPHVSDNGDCPSNWRTPDEFDNRIFGPDVRGWATWYRAAAAGYPPLTERIHCVQWNNWLGTAMVEARYGITLDANYYQWPQALFGAHPGLMTGSGLPQRLADTTGLPIPVWQATTQITDETPGTNSPAFIRQLIRNATGPDQWYGVFTANEHLDDVPDANRAAADITTAALAANIPVISARQLAQWETARAAAANSGLDVTGSSVSWTLTKAPAHATELVPDGWGTRSLRSLTVDGRALPFTRQSVNGIRYAVAGDAPAGRYTARYG